MSCPKVGYRTKKFAQTILNLAREKRRKRRPERVYACPHCNLWHLTSKFNRPYHFECWKPTMFEIQTKHWRKFAYYPTGKDKKFVMDNYIDGLAWIDSLNQIPDYKKDIEQWAGQFVQNVPLLISGDVHSMIALIRAATKKS